MLETAVLLTHEGCVTEIEHRYQDRVFCGHPSVTELEICRDAAAHREHADFCEEMAERQLAAAFRSTYETDFQYLEESLLTAGGFPAWE